MPGCYVPVGHFPGICTRQAGRMVVTADVSNNAASSPEATLDALRAGDAETFRRVVADLNPGLTRLAQTYVSAALAEEVVQETWASVIQALDSFEGRSSLKTWVYRIMLNKVRTLAGRESKIIPFAAMARTGDDGERVLPERVARQLETTGFWSAQPELWHLLPAEALERDEVLMMILEAIEMLPGAQREVVQLRDLEGWPALDVANALGISAVNQRVLLHRGRTAVRNKLEEYLSDES